MSADHPVRKGSINLKCPPDWRQGQTMVNFLWWLRDAEHKEAFCMEDTELEKLYADFMAAIAAAPRFGDEGISINEPA